MASGTYTHSFSFVASDLGFSNVKIFVEWADTPNVIENTSTVKVNVYVAVDYGISSSSRFSIAKSSAPTTASYSYITINGTKYSYSFQSHNNVTGGGSKKYLIASVTSNSIKHNADGSKSVSLEYSVPFSIVNSSNSTSSAGLAQSSSAKTIVLTTIQPVSGLTCSTAYIGETAKITISKAVNNFTDTITYTFGSLTGTIATKTDATGIDWIIPETFYAVIPNDSSGKGTLTVETFDTNGTSLGTRAISFTVIVKESISKPVINDFIVRNVNDEITALTGDSGTFIKNAGMVEYRADIATRNSATVKEQYIVNGSKKISGMPQGVIDNPESEVFTFTVVDSRGYTESATMKKTMIDYIKPTCHQEVEAELSGETSAIVKLKVYGSYFNDSFGAVANTLKLEVRHTQNDGTMGDWVELTNGLIPVFNGNSYTLEATISGFDYRTAYTFQCRATDKLNVVQSAQYTVKILPVFDWSETDINFNVPIGMNNAGTVLRHNMVANNTVLSATGGHIYLRPGGTDDTSSETVIYPNGDVKFGGSVSFAGSQTDFVIEYGTEPMGSNGTWHWEKWASGKAVCYGVRNFGRVAINSTFGVFYQSTGYTQDFPSGLFVATPDSIQITLQDTNAGGVWLGKNIGDGMSADISPSKNGSGMFCFMRPTTITTTNSFVSFYVIGKWKTVDSGEDEGGGSESFTGEVVGTVTTITRNSSDKITHIGVDTHDGNGETIYPCVDGVTHSNISGSGFSEGISIRITVENGYITHFVF